MKPYFPVKEVCLDWQKLILQIQRLTDFKAKMNKSKINKYKINNKTNTKHEFNVKYERYKQDISKDTLQMQKKKGKKPHIFAKTCLPVMPSLLPHIL